jgi:hypothetical protein
MRDLRRALGRVTVVAAVAFVVAVTVIAPLVDDRAGVPLVATATVAGVAVTIEIIRAGRPASSTAWDRYPPLWRRRPVVEQNSLPESLRSWEGALAAAEDSGPRSRQLLIRKLRPHAGLHNAGTLAELEAAPTSGIGELVIRFVDESGARVD